MANHVHMVKPAAFYKIDYFQVLIVLVGLGIPFGNIKRGYFYPHFRVDFVVCSNGVVQNRL